MTFRIDRKSRRFGLLALPWYGKDNPYQQMMYSQCDPADIFMANDPYRARALLWNGRVSVLHLHWDDAFITGAWKDAFHEALFDSPIAVFRRFIDNGGTIFWTVHNSLPHGFRNLSGFFELRRFLAVHAAAIHVHSRAAKQFVLDAYGAEPKKVHVISHPSYVDAYPDPPIRAELSGPKRLLHFGAIRRYKGLGNFLDAARNLAQSGLIAEVHVAGRVMGSGTFEAPHFPQPIKYRETLRRIEDDEIPGLFAEADFTVLPYARSMTSGTAMLSMTFGVPVVAPDIGGMSEMVPETCRQLLYDPHEPEALQQALVTACTIGAAELTQMRAACLRKMASVSARHVSDALGGLFATCGCTVKVTEDELK